MLLHVNFFVVKITLNGVEIDGMLDAFGKETFDITEAVEVIIGNTCRPLHLDDVITMTALKDR